MNVRRSVVAAAVAWLAVVAVGSTVVWAVISRAGEGVAPTTDPGVVATSTSPSTAPPPTPSSSRSPSRSAGPSGSSSGSPTGPSVVRRTWQGAGGLVIASCRGPVISLVSSSADAGFRVEVKGRGPEELELGFQGQGEEGRETELKARCEAGTPVFEVTTSGDD